MYVPHLQHAMQQEARGEQWGQNSERPQPIRPRRLEAEDQRQGQTPEQGREPAHEPTERPQ